MGLSMVTWRRWPGRQDLLRLLATPEWWASCGKHQPTRLARARGRCPWCLWWKLAEDPGVGARLGFLTCPWAGPGVLVLQML